LLYSLSVYEKAAAISAVLQAVASSLGDNRRAPSRDAAVRELQSVVAFASAADIERRHLREGDFFSRAVGSNDFQYGFGL
jgi:hypothetical protein